MCKTGGDNPEDLQVEVQQKVHAILYTGLPYEILLKIFKFVKFTVVTLQSVKKLLLQDTVWCLV